MLRVPMTTVHHGLIQQFNLPVRLVSVGRTVSFDVSDISDLDEANRLATISAMERYVVEHYDGIADLTQFSFSILKNDRRVMHYSAIKDTSGTWTVRKD